MGKNKKQKTESQNQYLQSRNEIGKQNYDMFTMSGPKPKPCRWYELWKPEFSVCRVPMPHTSVCILQRAGIDEIYRTV